MPAAAEYVCLSQEVNYATHYFWYLIAEHVQSFIAW